MPESSVMVAEMVTAVLAAWPSGGEATAMVGAVRSEGATTPTATVSEMPALPAASMARA